MTEMTKMQKVYLDEVNSFFQYRKNNPNRPYFNDIERESAYFELLRTYDTEKPKEWFIDVVDTISRLTSYDYDFLDDYFEETIDEYNSEPEYYDSLEYRLASSICTALEEDI